jgi:hypothetical protein
VFGWFRKYVRKIGIFGVEVEFHPPTETSASVTPPEPPPVAVPRTVNRLADGRSVGSVSSDKEAFLAQVRDKTNGEAERVSSIPHRWQLLETRQTLRAAARQLHFNFVAAEAVLAGR